MSSGRVDAPGGDVGALSSAASLLGSVAADLGGDLTSTSGAVGTALGDWRGNRREVFAQAGGGVQVQLKVAGDGCGAVASLIGQYARALAQAVADVAQDKHRSATVLANAQTQTKSLDPSSAQYDTTFQHASRQSALYEDQALAAKDNLAKQAGTIAAQIDAQTEKVAPVSSSLTPDQIRRQVDSELGLTGLRVPWQYP